MSTNIKFNYMYRDAGNFKVWGEVIFKNVAPVNIELLDTKLRQAFDDNLFIANQINVPELFLELDGKLTSNDHCYHQYENVEHTLEFPTDVFDRSIYQFIEQVELESLKGWKTFNVFDRT